MEKVTEQSGSPAVGQDRKRESPLTKIAVWNEAQDFAQAVAVAMARMRRERAADSIAYQLIRSAGSIAANIAEGYGRYSQAAYRNHLSIARGSAYESESWLDLLMRLGHLPPAEGNQLLAQCDQLQRMLTTRMKGLGDAKLSYVREDPEEYNA
jgi:four helix bundle protein